MSATASSPGRNRSGATGPHGVRKPAEKPGLGRPVARVFLRAAGMTALLCWAALLVWASFGDGASRGSSGVYMILGVVASVLVVACVVASTAARQGLRSILSGLFAAGFAAAAGWAVYQSMPDAGPDEFITHRAGVAALAYGFGVVGGGLIALAELVVEGYPGGRAIVPRSLRRKIGALAVALVVCAAAALTPAMERWAELANQEVRVGAAATGRAAPLFEDMIELPGVERFVETPFGLLRVDHPSNPTPQAVTLVDPATGRAHWYHRRWNWLNAQAPVLSGDQSLVGLSGPRADNPDDYQTRVLRTSTGEEVATAAFRGAPGALVGLADGRLAFASQRDTVIAVYDFDGAKAWSVQVPQGCKRTASAIAPGRLLVLTRCVPAPNRLETGDWVFAFDVRTGEQVWEHRVPVDAQVEPESFIVTGDLVVVDSRIERRVTDGPFSARRFDHHLIAMDTADGAVVWERTKQRFGPTHTSACGGTLHLSRQIPAAGAAAADVAQTAERQRTLQLVECYSAPDRMGAQLGVMAFDLETGKQLYRKSVELGFTPTDPEVARGWATVLPDNRAVLATDVSLDQTRPDCRLHQIADGKVKRLDLADDGLPPDWCRKAQLSAVNGGVAISFVNGEGTRGIVLIS